jgi:site-specific DNA recombinase
LKLTDGVFPLCVGKIPSKKHGVQPGIHQACVTEAVFNRVQLILKSKNPVTAAYQRNRPELPLRQFLTCPSCGHSLTGGKVTDKYGVTYWYYWYYWCTCRAVSIRADRAHDQFVELVGSLRFDAPLRQSFVDSFKEKWELKHGDSTTVVSRLSAQLSKEKDTRRNLLLKHVNNDPLIANNFSDLKASLDSTIDSLKM